MTSSFLPKMRLWAHVRHRLRLLRPSPRFTSCINIKRGVYNPKGSWMIGAVRKIKIRRIFFNLHSMITGPIKVP